MPIGSRKSPASRRVKKATKAIAKATAKPTPRNKAKAVKAVSVKKSNPKARRNKF